MRKIKSVPNIKMERKETLNFSHLSCVSSIFPRSIVSPAIWPPRRACAAACLPGRCRCGCWDAGSSVMFQPPVLPRLHTRTAPMKLVALLLFCLSAFAAAEEDERLPNKCEGGPEEVVCLLVLAFVFLSLSPRFFSFRQCVSS